MFRKTVADSDPDKHMCFGERQNDKIFHTLVFSKTLHYHQVNMINFLLDTIQCEKHGRQTTQCAVRKTVILHKNTNTNEFISSLS